MFNQRSNGKKYRENRPVHPVYNWSRYNRGRCTARKCLGNRRHPAHYNEPNGYMSLIQTFGDQYRFGKSFKKEKGLGNAASLSERFG